MPGLTACWPCATVEVRSIGNVWVDRLGAETPPGIERLKRLEEDRRASREAVEALDADPATFVARIAELLEEEAADGAILVEVRFGGGTVLRPEFMTLFRKAEQVARRRYPMLRAEAIACCRMPADDQTVRQLRACLEASGQGLAGIDFLPDPYDTEADWRDTYQWAERAAEVGLGITAHAGEFSRANVAAAVDTPGLTRIGHGNFAADDKRLLEKIARHGITIECCMTSNVVLGAVASYRDHPIRVFIAYGIPVTLNTDDPVRTCTTIGREYEVAASIGFSAAELIVFTRNAIKAAFISDARRITLLAEL
jgi:adenosine deaminase